MRSEIFRLYVLLFYNNVNVLCTITINKHNFLFFIIDGRGGIHALSICAGEFITKYIFFILTVSVPYLLKQFNNAIRMYLMFVTTWQRHDVPKKYKKSIVRGKLNLPRTILFYSQNGGRLRSSDSSFLLRIVLLRFPSRRLRPSPASQSGSLPAYSASQCDPSHEPPKRK